MQLWCVSAFGDCTLPERLKKLTVHQMIVLKRWIGTGIPPLEGDSTKDSSLYLRKPNTAPFHRKTG
jgi:hypothetical protein